LTLTSKPPERQIQVPGFCSKIIDLIILYTYSNPFYHKEKFLPEEKPAGFPNHQQ
jgi:hypothetical protein